MTKSNAQKAREANAREAEVAATESEDTAAQSSPADLAPLEPPTADESDDVLIVDGTIPTDAGDADVADPAPSDEAPADEPEGQVEGLSIDGPEDAEPDAEPEPEAEAEAEPAAPKLAEPRSVQLDAPEPIADVADAEQLPAAITITDAATKRLELNKLASVTDKDGNLVDPDEAFTEEGPSGQVQCRIRLFENGLATEFKRPVRTLLLAKGSWVTNAAADRVKDRLRKAAAEADEQD